MSDCQFCVHDHAPAEGYPGECPFFGSAKVWDPGRPKPPSVEQKSALAMREIELRHAAENRVAHEQAAQLERARAKTRAVLREALEQQREAKLAASRQAFEAWQAEYHAWRDG